MLATAAMPAKAGTLSPKRTPGEAEHATAGTPATARKLSPKRTPGDAEHATAGTPATARTLGEAGMPCQQQIKLSETSALPATAQMIAWNLMKGCQRQHSNSTSGTS